MCTKLLRCLGLVVVLLLSYSCSRDIDTKIEECFEHNDSTVDIGKLYQEAWDTLYYIPGACSYMTILNRIGPCYKGLWQDVCDKVLIMNSQNNKIVYYKEWDPNYGQKQNGIVFIFKDTNNIIAIPRGKAKFKIRNTPHGLYLTLAE